MLKHLSVQNYALIEKLEIDFDTGFTVITGETGAGKSIVLGALGLILGNRADTQILLDKEKKCIIEGVFLIKNYGLKEFFDLHDLDYDDQTIFRREINTNGKTRSFINDTPVKLNIIRELGEKLVNIHSQHKTITLNNSNFQLALLDNYVNHNKLLEKYKGLYNRYISVKNKLENLKVKEEKYRTDKDYFQFLFEELEKANPQPDEIEEIEKELEILNNAETIKAQLLNATQRISDEEQGIITSLNQVLSSLNHIARFQPEIEDMVSRINSNIIDIQDIESDLSEIEEKTEINSERSMQLEERLNLLNQLTHKHKVSNSAGLIEIKGQLTEKLESIGNLDHQISDTEQELNEVKTELSKIADRISNNRKDAIPGFEDSLVKILKNLGMPHAVFKIEFKKMDRFTADGKNKIGFLFTANKGSDPGEIGKIASGGELSRLMLSLKSLISDKNLLPTIIFDEIDMGVSGDIANRVGEILLKMSEAMQVITITHLPQIAGKGNTHLKVYKYTDNLKTKSKIKQLAYNERIKDIAQMLSGEKLTDVAMENARQLIVNTNSS